MLVQEAYTNIAERVGYSSSSTTDKAKMLRIMRKALKKMFRKAYQIAIRTSNSFVTVADTYLYYLDSRAMRLLNARSVDSDDNDEQLTVLNLETFRNICPVLDTTNDTGSPEYIIPLNKLWVNAQPSAASKIAVVSDSASDVTSYFVSIKGIVSGVEKTEKVTLNGTTSVDSTNTYTSLISITKDDTNGTVTCTSNAAAVTNITLLTTENEKEFWQVQLYEIPDAVYTIHYDFYITPWYISNDEDVIPIEDIFSDIFEDVSVALLMKLEGNQNWQSEYQIAMAEIDNLLDNNLFSLNKDARMGLAQIADDEIGEDRYA